MPENEAQRDQHNQARPALKTRIDPKKWAQDFQFTIRAEAAFQKMLQNGLKRTE